jgi:hypothetical protein
LHNSAFRAGGVAYLPELSTIFTYSVALFAAVVHAVFPIWLVPMQNRREYIGEPHHGGVIVKLLSLTSVSVPSRLDTQIP